MRCHSITEVSIGGGAEGLLELFVKKKLDEIPEPMRSNLLTAIVLSLIDLESGQRVAEGATAVAIAATVDESEKRFESALLRLSHPRVRLLEQIAEGRYRLTHERVVPVLRRLNGLVLAELDRTKLRFESDFFNWRIHRDWRFLLKGRLLTDTLRRPNEVVSGSHLAEKISYLEISRQRRQLIRTAGLVGALGLLGGVYEVNRWDNRRTQRRKLADWRLPQDLYEKQHQIQGLEIPSSVTDLAWLTSETITKLKLGLLVDMAALDSFGNLKNLELSQQLQTQQLSSLRLPPNLTSLSLNAGLLSGDNLVSIKWPSTLKYLDLNGYDSRKGSLAELPTGLEELTLGSVSVPYGETIKLKVPKGLKRLRIDIDLGSFSELSELDWWHSVTDLNIKDPTFADRFGQDLPQQFAWPSNLQSLSVQSIYEYALPRLPLVDLIPQLPNTVRKLTLSVNQFKSCTTELAGMENLRALILEASLNEPTSLAGLNLPPQIESLGYFSLYAITDISSMTIPKGIKKLVLDYMFKQVGSLKSLDELASLEHLYLEIPHILLPRVTELKCHSKVNVWVHSDRDSLPEFPNTFDFLGLRLLWPGTM